MKCLYCGAELLIGKDKCDKCGNYQHNAGKNNKNEESQLDKTKSSKKTIIYYGFGLIVLVIAVLVMFVVVNKLDEKEFYGDWHCPNDKISIKIDSKKIIKEDEQSRKEEIEYKLDSTEQKNSTDNIYYIKEVKSLSTEDPKFIITINSNEKDMMVFQEEELKYKCYRNK